MGWEGGVGWATWNRPALQEAVTVVMAVVAVVAAALEPLAAPLPVREGSDNIDGENSGGAGGGTGDAL